MREVLVHEGGESREIAVHLLGRTGSRVHDEGVVLVGDECLFSPCLASEGEPRPGARRIAERADADLQQARGQGVDDHGDGVRDVQGVDVGLDEAADHVGQTPRGFDDIRLVDRTLDVRLQRERGLLLETQEIDVGHDAEELPCISHHGDVVHTALEHQRRDLGDHRVPRHGDDR